MSGFPNFYVCNRKQCKPCDPTCMLTFNKEFAAEPDKPMTFGPDVGAVVVLDKEVQDETSI